MEIAPQPVIADDTPRKKHDDDDDLLALWMLHEPAYSGLLAGDGFTWSDENQEYISDTGTRLGHNQIRSIAIHFATACELDLEQNAALLANGDIDVDEWHRRAQQEIDDEYILLAALGVGGLDKLTDEDYAVIVGKPSTPEQLGGGIADAQARLQAFADELKAEPPADAPPGTMGQSGSQSQVINRAGMYAQPGYSIWQQVQRNSYRRLAERTGLKLEEMNVLDDFAQHCHTTTFAIGCPECSRAGWVPVGSLPAPGLRSCGGGCRCYLAYRVAPEQAETDEADE